MNENWAASLHMRAGERACKVSIGNDVEQIIAQCEQMSQRKGEFLSALRVDFIQFLATDESISLKMRDHL